MKAFKKAQVLRIYMDENLKTGGQLTYRLLVKKMMTLKLSGATVYKAVEGYGSTRHLHDAGLLEISENLPIVIETIDSPAYMKKCLKVLEPLLPKHCLVTLQDVRIAHPGR